MQKLYPLERFRKGTFFPLFNDASTNSFHYMRSFMIESAFGNLLGKGIDRNS